MIKHVRIFLADKFFRGVNYVIAKAGTTAIILWAYCVNDRNKQ